MDCSYCEKEIVKNAEVCAYCGKSVKAKKEKSRTDEPQLQDTPTSRKKINIHAIIGLVFSCLASVSLFAADVMYFGFKGIFLFLIPQWTFTFSLSLLFVCISLILGIIGLVQACKNIRGQKPLAIVTLTVAAAIIIAFIVSAIVMGVQFDVQSEQP